MQIQPAQLQARIDERLKLAVETKAPFGAGSYVKGNVLLIGEQASHVKTDPDQRPFCSLNGCSGWITEQLELANVPEEKLFWVNALRNDGRKVDLQQVMVDLAPRRVIALGHVARTLCQELDVTYVYCYHPQYWKRFRSKERYPLIEQLIEITS